MKESAIAPALLISDRDLVGAQFSDLMRALQRGVGRLESDSGLGQPRQPLAVALDRTRSARTGGLRTYLPEAVGNGYWDFIQVVPGIYTGITDAYYRNTHRLSLPEETMTKLRVICEGRLRLADGKEVIEGGSAHIHSLRRGEKGTLAYEIQPGKLLMVTMHITPEGLEDLGIDGDALHAAIARAHSGAENQAPMQPLAPAAELLRIASAMIQSRDRLAPPFRLTYVTGKSRELLTEALTSLFYAPGHDEAPRTAKAERIQRRLQEAQRILDATLAEPPTIEQLARLVGINRTTLKAEFKAVFGETIHQYQLSRRLEEARRLIEETSLPMAAIADRLGFSQSSQLSTAVRRHFGASPRELRRAQQG